jgi:hypothetical protein
MSMTPSAMLTFDAIFAGDFSAKAYNYQVKKRMVYPLIVACILQNFGSIFFGYSIDRNLIFLIISCGSITLATSTLTSSTYAYFRVIQPRALVSIKSSQNFLNAVMAAIFISITFSSTITMTIGEEFGLFGGLGLVVMLFTLAKSFHQPPDNSL